MRAILYIFTMVLLILSSQSWTIVREKEKTPERFKYYQAFGKKIETLEVIYLTWPDKKLPNFVRLEDFKKYVDKNELIEHCFYVDSKKKLGPDFSEDVRDKFVKKIPVKLKGKFFVTKQFDDNFPTRDFEELRRVKELGFNTENDEYKVFVID